MFHDETVSHKNLHCLYSSINICWEFFRIIPLRLNMDCKNGEMKICNFIKCDQGVPVNLKGNFCQIIIR